MTDATRIYVEGLRVTARGLKYRARLGSPIGPVIVDASCEPLLDASRALQAKGITGPVELWDAKRIYPRLAGDIARLAALTVDKSRDSFRRWMPFPVRGSGPERAICTSGLSGTGLRQPTILGDTAMERRP